MGDGVIPQSWMLAVSDFVQTGMIRGKTGETKVRQTRRKTRDIFKAPRAP